MIQTLSLAQVREAAVFAWHPLGYLLVNGELFRAVRMKPPAAEGYADALHVRRSRLRTTDHMVNEGWRHAEGCHCRFCEA